MLVGSLKEALMPHLLLSSRRNLWRPSSVFNELLIYKRKKKKEKRKKKKEKRNIGRLILRPRLVRRMSSPMKKD
jgi:hypothetical protein